MAITLIVERKIIPGAQTEVKDLLGELRHRASEQPGFLSGRTVVDAYSPCTFMTICDWSSMADWQRWESNPERLEVTDLMSAALQEEPPIRIWQSDVDAPVPAI